MNADEPVRSSEARAAAELALVRVVHHWLTTNRVPSSTSTTASSWAPSTCAVLGTPLATSRSRRFAPQTAGSFAKFGST